MKKIMFFFPLIYIGGTEVAILSLIKKLKGFDIYIGYVNENSDKGMLEEFSKYTKVVNVEKEEDIEVDYLVSCSMRFHLYDIVNKIKRKKTILWVHQVVNLTDSILNSAARNTVDCVVTVSKTISEQLENMFEDLKSNIEIIKSLDEVNIEGVYSHLSSADINKEYTEKQISIFREAKEFLLENIDTIKYYHIEASTGTINYNLDDTNAVRPGIILYGYNAIENQKDKINLKPIAKFKSKINFIKEYWKIILAVLVSLITTIISTIIIVKKSGGADRGASLYPEI